MAYTKDEIIKRFPPEVLEEHLAARASYRAKGEFDKADEIRGLLLKVGIKLTDGKDGQTTWSWVRGGTLAVL